MTIAEKLESFGFLNLIKNPDKLKVYKTIVDEEFIENKWLFLPNNYLVTSKLKIKEETDISTVDFMSVEIEGTSMYRGNLMSYLEDIKPLFDKRNLKFELGKENMDWGKKTNGSHPFKHSVNINGENITFFDGNLEDRNANNPQIYVENTIKILNQELKLLKSKERFFILTGLESVYYILGHKEMLENLKKREIFNASEVDRWHHEFKRKQRRFSDVWHLVAIEIWLEKFDV